MIVERVESLLFDCPVYDAWCLVPVAWYIELMEFTLNTYIYLASPELIKTSIMERSMLRQTQRHDHHIM